jgi:hypothetical protein
MVSLVLENYHIQISPVKLSTWAGPPRDIKQLFRLGPSRMTLARHGGELFYSLSPAHPQRARRYERGRVCGKNHSHPCREPDGDDRDTQHRRFCHEKSNKWLMKRRSFSGGACIGRDLPG